MANLITTRTKSFFLVVFCAFSFFTSNAQRREERHRQNRNEDARSANRNPRFHQQPPARNHHSQPSVRIREQNHDRYARGRNSSVDRRRNEHFYAGRYHYNNRRPVYNSHNPSWRYRYLPARRSIITSFPFSYQTINYGGCGYRYYNGAYYKPYNSSFIVVAPPVGISIHVLPFGYRRVYVNNYPYYYYNGTFYDQYEEDYRVVAPPVGAVVESLPQGYETVTIDGETYYRVDGIQYKPVVQENGEIWYEVIKVD